MDDEQLAEEVFRRRDDIPEPGAGGASPAPTSAHRMGRKTGWSALNSSPLRKLCVNIKRVKIKIDKAGRVVIPKSVRERFRFGEGGELQLEEFPGGIFLTPLRLAPSMVRENGNLVHLGRVPRCFDWNQFIEDIREEQIKELSGL
jgi:AbrB family looped-hinge helix DNA binding protein